MEQYLKWNIMRGMPGDCYACMQLIYKSNDLRRPAGMRMDKPRLLLQGLMRQQSAFCFYCCDSFSSNHNMADERDCKRKLHR